MGRITLVLGGARSGKSRLALTLAKRYKKVAFVATCEALDTEMKRRIRMHKKVRPAYWKTYEEARELVSLMEKIGDSFDCIVIDCLTLLVSNLVLAGYGEADIIKKAEKLLAVLKKKKADAIMVSNEVGLGIVPDNELGRRFRDIAGRVNQLAAEAADEAYLTISGIPLKIKGGV